MDGVTGGVTGFIPGVVEKQISDFYLECDNIRNQFSDRGIKPFWNTLDQCWASPRAKEFGDQYINPTWSIFYNIRDFGAIVCRNAIRAYNTLAAANGSPNLYFDKTIYPKSSWYTDPDYAKDIYEIDTIFDFKGSSLKESFDGNEVMNTIQVQVALDTLKKAVANCQRALANLPLDIALFDETGLLKKTFKDYISRMVGEISKRVEPLYASLEEALKEEVSSLKNAKNESIDVINS